jgi:hypothetical protein
MFAQLNPGTSKQRKVLIGSLALHGLLFVWLLHTPEPQLLMPTSVAIGHNGKVVAHLYFPTQSPDDSTTSSSDSATQAYRHQRLGHEKMTWQPSSPPPKLPLPSAPLIPSGAEDDAKTATLSKLGHGAPAGLPYGSVPGGPVYGDEIRPALPVATADPVIYPWQRPLSEGKVIISIASAWRRWRAGAFSRLLAMARRFLRSKMLFFRSRLAVRQISNRPRLIAQRL